MKSSILFKGKGVEDNLWYVGSLVHRTSFYGTPDDRWFILEEGEFDYDNYYEHEIVPESKGQFIGQTDRNGEKIFVGDLVVGGDFTEEDGVGVIVFDEDTSRFCIQTVGGMGGLVSDFDHYYGREFEVVGNIHDGPEPREREAAPAVQTQETDGVNEAVDEAIRVLNDIHSSGRLDYNDYLDLFNSIEAIYTSRTEGDNETD